VLDIEDQGPALTAGDFYLRVTNCGILGNAFLNTGRCNDPSLESPPGSGREALNYAALWVGGRVGTRDARVSGGPLLEFRAPLDAGERVRIAERGRLGARRLVDDDGDGRVDEEILDERDEDGDGEVDEDLGLFSQQAAVCTYRDDTPEAVAFLYETGERHEPLGVTVRQEAFAWAVPGFDRIAGLRWTITNHGRQPIEELRVGVLADLDSKDRLDRAGHLNDRITHESYRRDFFEGWDSLTVGHVRVCGAPPPCPAIACFSTLAQTVPVVSDAAAGSGLPAAAIVGLRHTTDPLGFVPELAARGVARAPRAVAFRYAVFAHGRPPGQGGLPQNDDERWAALRGEFPEVRPVTPDDYVVLMTCGPFARLEPGQSVEVSAALVAGDRLDSLRAQLGNAAELERGLRLNALPDVRGRDHREWSNGDTGLNGHEVCLEPPPGVTFTLDPHCAARFPEDAAVPAMPRLYRHGECVWTDADCDACTGVDGWDTVVPWSDPGDQPPAPPFRLAPGDGRVEILWGDLPEALLAGGVLGSAETRFIGYRVWKLQDWRERPSYVPPRPRWSLVQSFGADTALGALALEAVTDSSMDYERILYERRVHPPGRYRFTDTDVKNGFDYLYMVTTVFESRVRDASGHLRVRRAETPLDAEFAERVVASAAAREDNRSVWVVPNPFRARADWDRPPTYGDQLTRHVDFMGLPRALSTIRIWTLAGDFVAQIDHDGRGGDGQAAWNLVTRNGQEVASGVYLFTVDSKFGRQVGRFVIVR